MSVLGVYDTKDYGDEEFTIEKGAIRESSLMEIIITKKDGSKKVIVIDIEDIKLFELNMK